MSIENCASCKFSVHSRELPDFTQGDIAYCRRYPAQVHVTMTDKRPATILTLPIVKAHWYCGEFTRVSP